MQLTITQLKQKYRKMPLVHMHPSYCLKCPRWTLIFFRPVEVFFTTKSFRLKKVIRKMKSMGWVKMQDLWLCPNCKPVIKDRYHGDLK